MVASRVCGGTAALPPCLYHIIVASSHVWRKCDDRQKKKGTSCVGAFAVWHPASARIALAEAEADSRRGIFSWRAAKTSAVFEKIIRAVGRPVYLEGAFRQDAYFTGVFWSTTCTNRNRSGGERERKDSVIRPPASRVRVAAVWK